jgi:hypothetical protein
MSFVKSYPDLPWDYESLASFLEIEDIENHSEISWNYEYIARNPNITFDFVLKNIHIFIDIKYSFFDIVMRLKGNTREILDFFQNNNDLSMFMNILYLNPEYSIQELIKCPNVHLSLLSQRADFNTNILEKIEDYRNLDWETITFNKNITIDYIKQNQRYFWDKSSIHKNPNITMKQIENEEECSNLGIRLLYLYKNKNIFEYEKKNIIEENIMKKRNLHHELIQYLYSPDSYFHSFHL